MGCKNKNDLVSGSVTKGLWEVGTIFRCKREVKRVYRSNYYIVGPVWTISISALHVAEVDTEDVPVFGGM